MPGLIEENLLLHRSRVARIEKVCCLRARRGLSCEECKTEHQIAVPLSGVNVRHIGGESYTIAPSHVTLSNRGEGYKVSHPYGSGETQLTLVLDESVLLELLADLLASVDPPGTRLTTSHGEMPFAARQVPLSLHSRFAVHTLINAVRRGAHSDLEIDEAVIALTRRLLAANSTFGRSRQIAPRDKQLASRTHSLLAASYSKPITLETLAKELGVSVFHLCRVYRRATNNSLWSEIQRLRTCEALVRLAEGERDLTALGLSLGYSHHSHFTSSFRRQLGLTPSRVRQRLATASLGDIGILSSQLSAN